MLMIPTGWLGLFLLTLVAILDARVAKPVKKIQDEVLKTKYKTSLAAQNHLDMMREEYSCSAPRPIVIYPIAGSNKRFRPRGTVVFRCSDQSGCCPNLGEACRPVGVQEFNRTFFVEQFHKPMPGNRLQHSFAKSQSRNSSLPTETMSFLNHTSCHCVKLPPNTMEDLQGVLSRPLIVPLFSTSGYMVYFIASILLLLLLITIIVVFKCIRTSAANTAS